MMGQPDYYAAMSGRQHDLWPFLGRARAMFGDEFRLDVQRREGRFAFTAWRSVEPPALGFFMLEDA